MTDSNMIRSTVPVSTSPLPFPADQPPPLFALVGAGGGAGVSTLARLWAPAADSGQCWPANPTTTQDVYVVCREHIAGIAAAAHMLREYTAGYAPAGVRVHGLITVPARPGRTPKDIARYRDTVAELVPALHRISWCEELMGAHPDRPLPSWRPWEPITATKTDAAGDLATVPSQIATVGERIAHDLVAWRDQQQETEREIS